MLPGVPAFSAVLHRHSMGPGRCEAASVQIAAGLETACYRIGPVPFSPSLGRRSRSGARFGLPSGRWRLLRQFELRAASQHRMHDDRKPPSERDALFSGVAGQHKRGKLVGLSAPHVPRRRGSCQACSRRDGHAAGNPAARRTHVGARPTRARSCESASCSGCPTRERRWSSPPTTSISLGCSRTRSPYSAMDA